jgi:hypothetical protein
MLFTLIRYHVEIMIPLILEQFQDYNQPQAKLASLFVILGHLALNSDAYIGSLKPCGRDAFQNADLIAEVIYNLMPSLACASGLPRSITQLLVHVLIPRLFELLHYDSNHNISSAATDSNKYSQYFSLKSLNGIYQYLNSNRDCLKLLARQRQFYVDYRLKDRSTVHGLQMLGFDVGGEVVEDHLINILTDTLRINAGTSQLPPVQQSHLLLATEAEASAAKVGGMGRCCLPEVEPNDAVALQTKIIPFDELRLNVEEVLLSRNRNAAGRRRQNLIVCASLIDKVTNLAGIARSVSCGSAFVEDFH